MYRVELWSDFEELYRYNLFISCAGYDSEGEQIYVEGCEKIFKEEIVLSDEPFDVPDDFVVGERLFLESPSRGVDRLTVIVDVVANTLPEDRCIANSPPFALSVRVCCDDQQIATTSHQINQWGGANVVLDYK